MKPKYLLLYSFWVGLCVYSTHLSAQNRLGTGLKFNQELYEKVPLKASLTRGDFINLPSKNSLRKFAPMARSQGLYGNCVGWSSAYAARTIMLAHALNWTNPELINANAFSPFFIYEKAKSNQDINCQEGTNLPVALEIIKEFGVVKLKEFNEICGQTITSQHIQKAKDYKINDYQRLFDTNAKNKVLLVKKSLAENKPVLVGIQCCTESFLLANGKDTWKLQSTDNPTPDGGHAVTVVGYDDDKNGGSFEIMNSWGTKWGNEGFIWMTYEDFNRYCFEAYEMALIPKDIVSLEAEVKFTLSEGSEMQADYKEAGYYEMKKSYHSGTLYRLQITNREPAYMYVFSSDLTQKNYTIFPYNEGISPYIGYKGSNIAIPDEDHFMMMDNSTGTDYICILYSAEKLDVSEILIKLENSAGNFQQKIKNVLRDFLIEPQNIQYNKKGKIQFSAKSLNKAKHIIPIVIAIQHVD